MAEPGAPPLLLSDDFLAAVLAAYSPPAPNPPRAFAVKQLNVSDPLVRPPRLLACEVCGYAMSLANASLCRVWPAPVASQGSGSSSWMCFAMLKHVG